MFDDDDDDCGGRKQRGCLTLAAHGRKVSSSKQNKRQKDKNPRNHIAIHWGRTTQLSQNLLKTMFDFFFSQAQLHIDKYYQAKKIEKNSKLRF